MEFPPFLSWAARGGARKRLQLPPTQPVTVLSSGRFPFASPQHSGLCLAFTTCHKYLTTLSLSVALSLCLSTFKGQMRKNLTRLICTSQSKGRNLVEAIHLHWCRVVQTRHTAERSPLAGPHSVDDMASVRQISATCLLACCKDKATCGAMSEPVWTDRSKENNREVLGGLRASRQKLSTNPSASGSIATPPHVGKLSCGPLARICPIRTLLSAHARGSVVFVLSLGSFPHNPKWFYSLHVAGVSVRDPEERLTSTRCLSTVRSITPVVPFQCRHGFELAARHHCREFEPRKRKGQHVTSL